MPNLPYQTSGWSTKAQRAPKFVEYPFLGADFADAHARIIRRFFESTSFTPGVHNRTSYTNLLTRSEDFTHADWVRSECTATADQLANPADGLVTADKLESTNVNGFAYQVFTPASATAHTFSVWLRALAGTVSLSLLIYRPADATFTAVTANVTTEWQRFTVTHTCVDTATHWVVIGGNSTFTSGEIVYPWGAQLEGPGVSAAGPYIPTTTVARTISAPQWDHGDNSAADSAADHFAWLVDETPPEPAGPAGLVRWQSTYARVPRQQVTYGSRLLVRPVMHDVKSGTHYAVSFDDGVTSHRFASRVSVSAVGAITQPTRTRTKAAFTHDAFPAASVQLRGGSTTQTFFTTSTASQIQSTIQSGTGLTANVVKTYDAIVINISAGTLHWVECSDSRLTVEASGIGGSTASVIIRRRQTSEYTDGTEVSATPAAVRTIACGGAHGGSAGERLAVWNGDRLVGTTKAVAASGTSITILAAEGPWAAGSLQVTHVAFAGQAAARYVNGPVTVTVREVTDFYLPGVSVGITTPADIPLVAPKTDPVSWLGEIVAAATYSAIEGSQLTPWRGTGIYGQTTVSAQMSDAIDTVSVSA